MNKLMRAEMWDKMQYLFRNYYDRMMHCVLYYDGTINKELFKQALQFQMDNIPVLHSRYHNNAIKPYWVINDYSVDEVLTVKKSVNLEYDVNKFLTGQISIKNNVQIQIGIFEQNEKTSLCFLINHMCFDGGDLKYFIKKLCANYTILALNGNNMSIKSGSRAYDMVYSAMDDQEKKYAKSLYKNISAVKDRHRFPLTEKSDDDKKRILTHKISAEKFEALKKSGKALGHTLNDSLLACYFQSLYEVGGYKREDSVTIPCMVDLRRHMKQSGEETGLTNHTGFMTCTVNGVGGNVTETLKKVAENMEKNKNDKYLGLYSLPLLHLAYLVFPHCISEFAIKLGYSNPLIGMSNIGVIIPEDYKLGDIVPYDGFYTGAVKEKPFMQLALTSFNGEITFSIAICGNTRDEAAVNKFFYILDKNIDELIATAG